MHKARAIILAAGLSQRMGQRNKLLLPFGGVPMIRRIIDVYSTAISGDILVVTGHAATDISKALIGSTATTVFNPDFAKGQSTSVACGLRAVGDAGAIIIGLGDQPLLKVDDLQTLLAAHAAADPQRISIPMFDQQRGNPIIVPGGLRARLLADPHSPGCKAFTRANPDHVQFHALASPGFYKDIDTPEDYDALAGNNHKAPA